MPFAYTRIPVSTRDGFRLTLFRHHRHRPEIHRDHPPVLLLPGMGSNRFTFALTADDGLPELLFRAGFDVWIGEFRGSRSSTWLGRVAPPVRVAAKLDADLPAMLEVIARHTEGRPVSLIGHSLGGLLALLHAGLPERAASVASVVTLCTPGAPPPRASLSGKAVAGRVAARGLSGLDALKVAPLARVRGPVPHLVALSSHFRPGTTSPGLRRQYFEAAVEDIPGAELADLLRWQTTGRLELDLGDAGLRTSCLVHDRLPRVQVPVLAIASSADGVVPAERARFTFDRLTGANNRTWRLVGRQAGARHDYAHADLLLASSAREDVLLPVVAWLDATIRGGRSDAANEPQKLAMI
jgi:pimeloyl-ACP methyl ester carboxylesterase